MQYNVIRMRIVICLTWQTNNLVRQFLYLNSIFFAMLCESLTMPRSLEPQLTQEAQDNFCVKAKKKFPLSHTLPPHPTSPLLSTEGTAPLWFCLVTWLPLKQ